MQRRNFISKGGIMLAAASPLAWADDDNENKSTKKPKPTPSPAPTPTPTPTPIPGTVKSHVIVIGGGMAGVTVAKYLRLWGDNIGVTLIERESSYVSNIMSSLVLSGQRTMASLTYNYNKLITAYGVTVIKGDVSKIGTTQNNLQVEVNGEILKADRIVIAPGIDFDEVPGLGISTRMPHAWKAGPQTALLAKQLANLVPGQNVILTIPKAPYRCPPGPYERACLIGDWLNQKKNGSKLTVLDANADILVEADNFRKAFAMHGITYIPNAGIKNVVPTDTGMMTVTTNEPTTDPRGVTDHTAHVVNLIPPQKAGKLVYDAGLNILDGKTVPFAPVDVLTYESTIKKNIHVIGDAADTGQPKAGHIANQEAKVCADAIVRAFAGAPTDLAPVTNSACYSTITMTQASWLTAVYQYDAATSKMKVAGAGVVASTGWNAGNFSQMNTWFNALMADSFA